MSHFTYLPLRVNSIRNFKLSSANLRHIADSNRICTQIWQLNFRYNRVAALQSVFELDLAPSWGVTNEASRKFNQEDYLYPHSCTILSLSLAASFLITWLRVFTLSVKTNQLLPQFQSANRVVAVELKSVLLPASVIISVILSRPSAILFIRSPPPLVSWLQ